MKRGERGAVLLWVMVLVFIGVLLFQLSFLRSALGTEQVKRRYLDGIALDAAGNGVEVMTHRGGATVREHMGVFAGHDCFIEAHAEPVAGGLAITSRGLVFDRRGRQVARREVRVRARPSGPGWSFSSWQETAAPE